MVAGQPAKRLLWSLKERWPQGFNSQSDRWTADINIGSLSVASFNKKNGEVGAVLKGRLLNIRNLKIGNELVAGEEWNEQIPEPSYHAISYLNDCNFDKSFLKISVLDGKIEEPNYQSLNVNFDAQAFPVFAEMQSLALMPKGIKNKESNAKVFCILSLTGLTASGFKTKEGDNKAAIWASLASIRYLKADDTVFIGGKEAA
ncbi:Protein of uncharacterised function (DUF3577) [Suttonella ornithocola]|uniref:Protein of uncharacterized function (DUF3577) n=1 Tax=Suttonella ornithocola TaxID=279832 RepID=A0A380MYH3_9GAMM|nr:Protein of uncharacterised function (DUF3577) [Suttonella ornithocola]